MIENFKRVNKRLYRGGAPSINDVAFLHHNLDVSKIVSLDEDVGKKIHRACKLLGIKHITLPIDIERKASLFKFLSHDIEDLLSDDEGSVFVHCIHGKDRTGLAMALYRIQHDGWSAQKAIEEAMSFGFGIGVSPSVVRLYLNIIRQAAKDESDINDSYDIVSNQREYPSDYQDYTLGPWAQQSWSPFDDYSVREFPYAKTEIDWPEQYSSRIDHGLDDSEFVRKRRPINTPQVGQWDTSTQGIMGAGPSLVYSGYV